MTDETSDLPARVSMMEADLYCTEGRLDTLAEDALTRVVILEENLARAEERLDVLEEWMRRVSHEPSST